MLDHVFTHAIGTGRGTHPSTLVRLGDPTFEFLPAEGDLH